MTALYKILNIKSKVLYFFLALIGIINSAFYSGILWIISTNISNEKIAWMSSYGWIVFISLILVSAAISRYFQAYLVRMTNEAILSQELSLMEKLRQTSWQAFQKLGSEKVYTAFGDIVAIGQMPRSLINLINAFVTLICGLVYTFYLSLPGGLLVVAVIGMLLLIFFYRNRKIEKDLNCARDLQNSYHRYLKDFLQGFREIKLSQYRNDVIFNDYIKHNRAKNRAMKTSTMLNYVDNDLISTYSWYVIIGFIIFVLPTIVALSTAQVASFIIVIFFLLGPLDNLTKSIPAFTNIKISIERVTALENQITQAIVTPNGSESFNESFAHLRFEDLRYSHSSKEVKKFEIGPLTLDIRKGELTFITGGNGSGKSTFVYLLAGLCKPHSGRIYLNDHLVMPENFISYVNQFSVIFSDHYLFQENYDHHDLSDTNEEFIRYLNLMELGEIVKIDRKRNHISTSLSRGQQKRLALIYALMEKRDILVLDEWAAEQDPDFRKIFYVHLLPVLKSLNKTVIIVTHDDRYFNCADRIIEFEYGKVLRDTKIIERSSAVIN